MKTNSLVVQDAEALAALRVELELPGLVTVPFGDEVHVTACLPDE